MAEYIEREALKEKFCDSCKNCLSEDDIADLIDDMTAADVAPVVHGHWFFTEYEFFTCSVCGDSYYNGAESRAQAESYLNNGNKYKYCPNCGARMDGAK